MKSVLALISESLSVYPNNHCERDSRTPVLEGTRLGIKRLGPKLILTNQIKGAQHGALFKAEICNRQTNNSSQVAAANMDLKFSATLGPILFCCQDSRHNSEEVPTLFPCQSGMRVEDARVYKLTFVNVNHAILPTRDFEMKRCVKHEIS